MKDWKDSYLFMFPIVNFQLKLYSLYSIMQMGVKLADNKEWDTPDKTQEMNWV